ncbi:MAG: amino acid-binding protein [Candidatus Altiarchaeales archaeon]|nr:amino acid-binding protein [Candidatus Altiarchaeales archaeon]MBD3415772.1 amino acid-binding protein [Candidatus Altiarchaeales archaeon]
MLDLEKAFSGKGAQRRVAEYLLRNGIRVSAEGELLAGEVEVSMISVSRVLEVDRRVVKSTVRTILGREKLRRIFENLAITPSLRELAPILGYGAIEIIPDDAAGKGIVAGVTNTLSNANIGIRQVIADDPMFDNPEMTVITENPIPRNMIDKLLRVRGVHKVVVLN